MKNSVNAVIGDKGLLHKVCVEEGTPRNDKILTSDIVVVAFGYQVLQVVHIIFSKVLITHKKLDEPFMLNLVFSKISKSSP